MSATGDAQGHARGTVRFADPHARLSLMSVTLTALHMTTRGATISGWQRAGHARQNVTIVVMTGRPARVEVRAGRYYRAGSLSGTFQLQPARSCGCWPGSPSTHVQASLAVKGHTHLMLRADVALDAARHPRGRLRWSDPGAHVTLDTTALASVKAAGNGLTVSGWQGAGKKRQSFTLTVTGGRAAHMDLRLGRYHRTGSLSGTVQLHLPVSC